METGLELEKTEGFSIESLVDSVLIKAQESEYGDLINDNLRTICIQIINEIIEERKKLNFSPHSEESFKLLTQEIAHTAIIHKRHNHLRDSGEDYFETHLVGATRNIIRDQGITGIVSILAAFKHDDIEDIIIKKEDPLFSQQLENGDSLDSLPSTLPKPIRKILKQTRNLILGVSKIRSANSPKKENEKEDEETKKQTKAATFRKLLETIKDFGTRVINVKIGDRCSNMETIKAKSIEDQKRIARETIQIYIPLGRLCRIHIAEEKLLKLCTEILNPELLKAFDKEVEESEKTFLHDKNGEDKKDIIFTTLMKRNGISKIELEEQTFAHGLKESKSKKSIEEMSIQDLNIDKNIPRMRIFLETETQDSSNSIIGFILKEFSPDKDRPSDFRTMKNSRGYLLKYFCKSLGCMLLFRINDSISEARSKRGVLANFDEELAQEITDYAVQILNEEKKTKRDIFEIAEETILKPSVTVYSADHTIHEFPKGATMLDFARKIHPDMLLNIKGGSSTIDPFSNVSTPVNIFDELPDGHRINIITESREIKDLNTSPDLRWLLFCNTRQARKTLRKYFCQNTETKKTIFCNYIWKLSKLLNIDETEIINIILKKYTHIENQIKTLMEQNENSTKTYKDLLNEVLAHQVTTGDIPDVIETIAQHLETQTQPEKSTAENIKTNYNLKIKLPDKPGILVTFLNAMEHENINIHKIESSEHKNEQALVKLEVDFSTKKITTFEFLKSLIKLQLYGYDIKLAS